VVYNDGAPHGAAEEITMLIIRDCYLWEVRENGLTIADGFQSAQDALAWCLEHFDGTIKVVP
jgi:hypothetical protein